MARIESMMEALLQERAMYTTSLADLRHEGNGSDIAMSMSLSASVNPALPFLGQLPQNAPPQNAIDPLLDADTATVRLGNRNLMFPDNAIYQGYITMFFDEFHAYYPCVDEQRFRSRSQRILAVPEAHPGDACFLALNYIIFALHAVSNNPAAPDRQSKPPGWHWLQHADDVIGKRQLMGYGDVSLAQFLLFKDIAPLITHAEPEATRELDEYLDFMVHWSQFAGSLWDNVLAAHVRANNLAKQALTFNAAVDDFILQTFIEVGERWAQVPDIRFPMIYNGIWATNGGYVETDRGFHSWDAGLESGGARSGVLWV
ncbi:hypothetical protein N0V91_008719 [Didymella pomorum]|uniref:Uncharacterized protein n=1 Tax=Didymella pomorum TaxID=749634 RepID=A0A9W8ZAT1_9PLEO|nr:hypothetical protein N0V91_008719 [Didymella pomorum]